MKRRIAIAVVLSFCISGNGQAQNALEDEASSILDVVMIWTACKVFEGSSELEAMKRAQAIMGKVAGSFRERRPEMLQPLHRLLPEGGERYEKQMKFLRTLSGDNRNTICYGVNDTMKNFGG